MSSSAVQAAEVAVSPRRDVEQNPITSCYAGQPDMIEPPSPHDDQASEGLPHLLVTPPSSSDPPTPPTRVIPAVCAMVSRTMSRALPRLR